MKRKNLVFVVGVAVVLFFASCKPTSQASSSKGFFDTLDNYYGEKFTNDELNGTSWKGVLNEKQTKFEINNGVITATQGEETFTMNLNNSIAINSTLTQTEPTAVAETINFHDEMFYLTKFEEDCGNIIMIITKVNSKTFFEGKSDSIYGTWQNDTELIKMDKGTFEVTSSDQTSSFEYELIGKGFEEKSALIKYSFYNPALDKYAITRKEDWQLVNNGIVRTDLSPEDNYFTLQGID